MLQVCTRFYILCLILFSTTAYAGFESGKHYYPLTNSQKNNPNLIQISTQEPDKVKVMFFFSYSCFWCGQLNKPFDKWAEDKTNNVKISYHPVVYNKHYKVLAKAFYMAQKLENGSEIDDNIYKEIHSRRSNLAKEESLKNFFAKYGVSANEFDRMYNSFDIERKVQFTDSLARGLKISITPNIVIHGPKNSYVTSWELAGTKEKLFEIIDYLISVS